MFYLSSITQAYPFLSLLFSIILMIGLYQIGEIILYNKQLNLIFNNISEINYQKILVAINLIMILLLPVVLFFKYKDISSELFSPKYLRPNENKYLDKVVNLDLFIDSMRLR